MKNFTQINQILQQDEERKVKHRIHPLAELIQSYQEKKFPPASDDYKLLIEGQYGDFSNLTQYEKEKFAFLLKDKSIDLCSQIPNQKEILFLEQIQEKTRKDPISMERLKKIAITDWEISPNNLENLIQKGHLIIDNNKAHVPFSKKSPILNHAFIWMNSSSTLSPKEHAVIMAQLGIEEPHPRQLALLKGKLDTSLHKGFYANLKDEAVKCCRPVKMSIHDYSLFFKVIQGKDLVPLEEQRLDKLRSIGIHPESQQSIRFLNQDPRSFKLKAALNKERMQYYQEKYGVNESALNFVNTFKQASQSQLQQMGLSNETLGRYAQGVKDPILPTSKILNKHVLPTSNGPEVYYSIHHNGSVSGRAFLEKSIPGQKIFTRPQLRQDLIYHDLRVVDALLALKKEYEEKGHMILKIENESSQYSKEKKGKMNHERKNGPSFMDVIMVVQNPHDQSLQSIAIEYGNYSLERMKSKIESSTFDKAYIYSNDDHCQKYNKSLGHYGNVVFRAL